jgi:hypothetical protein
MEKSYTLIELRELREKTHKFVKPTETCTDPDYLTRDEYLKINKKKDI